MMKSVASNMPPLATAAGISGFEAGKVSAPEYDLCCNRRWPTGPEVQRLNHICRHRSPKGTSRCRRTSE